MQRVAYLETDYTSRRIGRVFAKDRGEGASGFLKANIGGIVGESYYLHSPWWEDRPVRISAREFRHICLLTREINQRGLPDGLREELTWNA